MPVLVTLGQCHITKEVILVLTPPGWSLSHGYFAISERSPDTLYPEQLKTKSQVNILLPAIPLGNRFELPAELGFFSFFILDAVAVGGDLTKLSGNKRCTNDQRKQVENSTAKNIVRRCWQHSFYENTRMIQSSHRARATKWIWRCMNFQNYILKLKLTEGH